MPLGNVIILSAIIFAFVLFAVVLAWCDFYSRGASKQNGQHLQASPNEKDQLKNAA